jgi:PII-like signaling protein
VVVEIVDEPEVIGSLLPVASAVAPRALITAQEVSVRLYRRSPRAAAAVTGRPDRVSGLDMPPWADAPEGGPAAAVGEAGQLARVFMRGCDTLEGESLYRAAVLRGRELGLAWAAVFRGTLGYGGARCRREARLFSPLAELPLVVEIVDRARNVQQLLAFLDAVMQEGIVTLENVALGGD